MQNDQKPHFPIAERSTSNGAEWILDAINRTFGGHVHILNIGYRHIVHDLWLLSAINGYGLCIWPAIQPFGRSIYYAYAISVLSSQCVSGRIHCRNAAMEQLLQRLLAPSSNYRQI